MPTLVINDRLLLQATSKHLVCLTIMLSCCGSGWNHVRTRLASSYIYAEISASNIRLYLQADSALSHARVFPSLEDFEVSQQQRKPGHPAHDE